MERHRLSSAIVLSIAIVVTGIMLPVAVKNYRAFDRTVTVKGLCEREVEADKVVWPINYRVASEHLNDLTTKMESSRKAIVQFPKDGGIDESEITFSAPIISDTSARMSSPSARIRSRRYNRSPRKYRNC